MLSLNVRELTDEVRNQLDEFNEASVTDAYILEALNRAQKAATRITARRLDTIFLSVVVISTSSGEAGADGASQEFDMPSDVFGRRIEKVELRQSGSQILWRVQHISYKERDPFVITSQVTRPYYYDIIGSKIRLYPNPDGNQDIIIHYSRTPDKLVLPQGQINSIDRVNNYLIVDSLGSDISTESDERASYINIVDFITGDVKATLQAAFLDEGIGQIKFKSSGLSRTVVFDKTVTTAIPEDVVEDDYICLVKGTAVPQLPDAYTDYLVQHAIVAVKRRIREPTQEEYAALKDIEDNLKKLVTGRENSLRVRKANSYYGRTLGGTLRKYFS